MTEPISDLLGKLATDGRLSKGEVTTLTREVSRLVDTVKDLAGQIGSSGQVKRLQAGGVSMDPAGIRSDNAGGNSWMLDNYGLTFYGKNPSGTAPHISYYDKSTGQNIGLGSFYSEWQGLPHYAYSYVMAHRPVGAPWARCAVILATADQGTTYNMILYSDGALTTNALQLVLDGGSKIYFAEIADPAAAPADRGVLYMRDNGAGKTQLCVRFQSGAVQVVAQEP